MHLNAYSLCRKLWCVTLVCVGVPLLSTSVLAQQYTNVVNTKFAAVGNGPQSAIIIDVPAGGGRAATANLVTSRMRALDLARDAAVSREIAALRSKHALPVRDQVPVVDTVLMRTGGRLPTPTPASVSRAVPSGNNITFVVNTTGSYAFTATDAAALSSAVNTILYPALVNVLGSPLWNGQVTILNKDDNPTKVSGIIGVTVVVNTNGSIDIDLPTFSADQDKYLGLLQAMAQTFYGSEMMGFDSFNTGFARAAAVIAAQNLQGRFPTTQTVDPAADFYYTPYYDLLNQQPLGNSTFFPPTKMAQPISGQFGGMLIPRLQMASTAWIKCYIENSQFFINFNNAYYDAWQLDHTVANDEGRLSALAAAAVGGTVEGQPFNQWFQQQYIFDTSVTPGAKTYAFVSPTLASSTQPQDGAAVVLLYYSTTATGDEIDQSAVSNPVFYDYTYLNRLTLPGADTSIQIPSGEGYTAPIFSNIGVNPEMRVTMDFPVNGVYTRVPYPANASTTSTFTPNEFFGVTVGSDTGNLSATFSGGNGTAVSTSVKQGAFGAVGGASIPDNFTKVTITYQPVDSAGVANGAPVTFVRNVFQRKANSTTGLSNVSSIFVLNVQGTPVTLSHTFLSGPQLISMPLQPFNPDLAQVFGVPAAQTLLAQWNQALNSANGDNYVLYPSLPLYQPGYALWSNFPNALNGGSGQNGVPITGTRTDNQTLITIGLQYGWNMIGDPFNSGVTLLSNGTTGTNGGVVFQYQGGAALTLADAVNAGYVSAGVFGYNGDPNVASYVDITQTQAAGSPFTQNFLMPWQGYFILVNVTEGLTMTYINPSPNTRAVHLPFKFASATHRSAGFVGPSGWTLPIMLQDMNGSQQVANLGESTRGSTYFNAGVDTPAPPAFSSTPGLSITFQHPEWQQPTRGISQSFVTDIRHLGTQSNWNLLVTVPHSGETYRLAWPAINSLPHGQMLVLTDLSTNTRVVMNSTSSYSFTTSTGETARRFQVSAAASGPQVPLIVGLRANINLGPGGRGVADATIAFSSTGVGTASVSILGPNGQTVRHLVQGRAVTAGANSYVWDLRNDHGIGLPTGTYLAQVTLTDPNGRLTRAIAPVTVIR